MKSKWRPIRLGLVLLVLPLTATAAASTHALLTQSVAIQLDIAAWEPSVQVAPSMKRVHSVALSSENSISGRVASIANASISNSVAPKGLDGLKVFFVQNGTVVSKTVTEPNGAFVAKGLKEGVYSFIASGANGFAAYGVEIVAASDAANSTLLEVAAVSPRAEFIQLVLKENLPSEVAQEVIAMNTGHSSEAIVGSSRIALSGGVLTGSLASMTKSKEAVEQTKVYLFRGDQQVGSANVDASGGFSISGLEAGIYDFVAAGPGGFAAVSIEAIEPQAVVATENSTKSKFQFVSLKKSVVQSPSIEYATSMRIFLASSQDSVVVESEFDGGHAESQSSVDSLLPIEYASESIGYGCASGASCGVGSDYSGFSSCNPCGSGGGGGGGGFGSGFGGSRLGRLALLGGLAVGIVAISDSDAPGAVSPVNP